MPAPKRALLPGLGYCNEAADFAWDTCRAEALGAVSGLVSLLRLIAPEIPYCVPCRAFSGFDEDGCCTTCGGDIITLPIDAALGDYEAWVQESS